MLSVIARVARPASTAVVAAFVSGCGSVASPSLTVEPTAAVRPAIPDGWTKLATEEGDIRLVVPPDVGLTLAAPGSVTAQAPMRDGVIPFEVMAIGPGQLGSRGAGQSVSSWMQETGWLPRAAEGVKLGPVTERETMLPAGRALQVATSVQPGTPEEGRVVIFVIETEVGLALLRFVGTPAGMEERAADMDLISQLVEFGL